MSINKKDLKTASGKLRDSNSKKARSEGGQTLALYRWEQEYKREVKTQRSDGSRRTGRGR